MKKIYTLFILAISLTFSLRAQDTTIVTFTGQTHSFANTLVDTFMFPADLSAYETINMRFWLTCPAGGCDPWDRYANIRIEHEGEDYEIGRYITPYLNGDCGWELDVTAYRTMLEGETILKSYIETWSGGWDIHIEFDLIAGTPDYLYTFVDNLWVLGNFRYGDTTEYSIDLPAQSKIIPTNAEKTVFRIVNTGHGQGNTGNAAEFLDQTHTVDVNGVNWFQYLWNNTCNTNPCSPQSGNWSYPRAGWCPGMEVVPDDYDATAYVTAGDEATFDYILEPYYNRCSPYEPTCNTSFDCMSWVSTCDYNSSDHTQPNYKISGQVIHYSNTPFSPVNVEPMVWGANMNVYPNPNTGRFKLEFGFEHDREIEVKLVDLQGKMVWNEHYQAVGKSVHEVKVEEIPTGMYILHATSGDNHISKKLLINQ